MTNDTKTHFRKAFNSPYLSSADIVDSNELIISHVILEADKTKRTKDQFNTAYFTEKFLRDGEQLKPMILNATNSKEIRNITGSPFIDDWQGVRVVVYVDKNVKFGRETMEGLRIAKAKSKPVINKSNAVLWNGAINAYKRDGDFLKVLQKADLSQALQDEIIKDCQNA